MALPLPLPISPSPPLPLPLPLSISPSPPLPLPLSRSPSPSLPLSLPASLPPCLPRSLSLSILSAIQKWRRARYIRVVSEFSESVSESSSSLYPSHVRVMSESCPSRDVACDAGGVPPRRRDSMRRNRAISPAGEIGRFRRFVFRERKSVGLRSAGRRGW